MKKLVPLIIVLLFGISLAFSVQIESCSSDGESNWDCDTSDICVCELSGDCTDGRLLVYETDVRNLLCLPKIVNGYVDILWDDCDNPTGEVKVRADCEEGQSSEETIDLVSGDDGGSGGGGSDWYPTTTTTTTTTTTIPCEYPCHSVCEDDNNPPFCYDRISHGTAGCPGGSICCESVLKECPASTGTTIQEDKTCPYECCMDMPGYEYKPCSSGMVCCDHLCKESCEESGLNINNTLVFWVILASIIPIAAFLFFIWKRSSDSKVPEY